MTRIVRASTQRSPLVAFVVGCVFVVAHAAGQAPTFFRGPGELLAPELRSEPSPLTDMADLTLPEYLWAFQRERLMPPGAAPALAADEQAAVVAALLAASRSVDEQLRWQSLWALARIGRNDAAVGKQLHARVGERAAPGGLVLEQAGAVGDVGCLCVGLAARGEHAVLKSLATIAHDEQLDVRRRAFAFYGLGLAAQESSRVDVQFRVLAAVERALLGERRAPDEARVAALHALALLRVDAAPKLPGPVDQLLARVWDEQHEADEKAFAFRAHVPFAIAAVCAPGTERALGWCERLGSAAQERFVHRAVARACVLALGRLAGPWRDEQSPGAETGELLQRLAKSARDLQSKYFALFAMGEAGGELHVRALEQALAGSQLARGWAAFGLVASVRGDREAAKQRAASIAAAIERTRHPGIRANLELALAAVERDGGAAAMACAPCYRLRYGVAPPPGDLQALLARVADEAQPLAARRGAAAALGHLADSGETHWSTRLASAIDYRNGTASLLAFRHGVLRLP